MGEKERSKRGEARKKFLELLEDGPKTPEELQKKVQRSTYYHIAGKLEGKGKIQKIDVEDPIVGCVKKWTLIPREDIADPIELDSIMKKVESNIPQVREVAIEDLRHISARKDITIPKVLESVCTYFVRDDTKFTGKFLNIIINQLGRYMPKRDKHDDLIKILKREDVVERVRGIASDRSENDSSENLSLRSIAFQYLLLINDSETFDLAFKVLKEDSNVFADITSPREIIINQVRKERVKTRGRLYKLLANDNEKIRSRAASLLDATRQML